MMSDFFESFLHRRILLFFSEIIKNNVNSLKMVEGEFEVNTQYHFYMETQTILARPSEKGQIDMHASTQWSSSQHFFPNLRMFYFLFINCFIFIFWFSQMLKTENCFLFQLRIIGKKNYRYGFMECCNATSWW